jgi:DNA topoisomerase-1
MARNTASKTLVIVESPTKAKTIGEFLGKEYSVESSYGHVRDLPKSKLGIDTDNNFEPQYVIPRKVQPHVTALKKLAAKSERVILATDEDREGEAIAWHIASILGEDGGKLDRIVFHEITKSAIQNALTHPRKLDLNLVNAQQGRRVLDRLVGYKLSPFLWKKIARGLSAGRVQSVALRLIVEREEEIKNFKVDKYFTLEGDFKTQKGNFGANLSKIQGEPLPKLGIVNEAEAQKIKKELEKLSFKVTSVEKKEMRKHPLPPFITSTLQQSASQNFGFSSKKTMFLAQGLYENGHITYMRTDSVNLSEDALTAARSWIKENLGDKYLIPDPRRFKTKSRLAQEAHEAIRPTNPANSSPKLGKDEAKVYDLIWKRFMASQLPEAVFDATKIEATSEGNKYGFAANGNVMKFDGFLKIWRAKFEEKNLPEVKEGENAELTEVKIEEHQTEPPPRYNEASLIKILEKNGIGRPSTYAPIISVIQARNYVEKQQGRFYPTEIGTLVNKVLTEYFPEIVDLEFTAKMEDELDDIADGKIGWQEVIREFYGPFSKHLEKMYEEVQKKEIVDEKTDQICEVCGKPMIIKFGRFGKFLACSGYPECKNTKPLKKEPPKSTGLKCSECLASPDRKNNPGELVERRVSRGRARGKIFWGCSRYPECKHATWVNPLNPPEEKQSSKKDELEGVPKT